MQNLFVIESAGALEIEDVGRRIKKLGVGEEFVLRVNTDPGALITELVTRMPRSFDVSPIERGPERWSYHFIARSSDVPRRVSDYLVWDHDRLDGILEQVMADAAAGLWDKSQLGIARFRHGLFRHADLEDEVLFPAYEERTGMHAGGPTEVMRDEHVAIKEAVDAMVEAIRVHEPSELEQWHANLLGVLVEHNMKEEEILYPGTDRVLNDEEVHDLVIRMLVA